MAAWALWLNCWHRAGWDGEGASTSWRGWTIAQPASASRAVPQPAMTPRRRIASPPWDDPNGPAGRRVASAAGPGFRISTRSTTWLNGPGPAGLGPCGSRRELAEARHLTCERRYGQPRSPRPRPRLDPRWRPRGGMLRSMTGPRGAPGTETWARGTIGGFPHEFCHLRRPR